MRRMDVKHNKPLAFSNKVIEFDNNIEPFSGNEHSFVIYDGGELSGLRDEVRIEY